MSESTTPLVLPGPFYLPVILPPDKFFTIPQKYYKALEEQNVTVTASSADPLAPLEITVSNISVTQERKTGENPPVSTVFAATAGFLTFDHGKVVLRVWPGHFKNLVKSPDGFRPNRIEYGSLDSASIQAAISKHIAKLPLKVLQESWTQAQTGTPPADVQTLADALFQRFILGDGALYVDAGAPLGTGSTSQGGDTASLTLQASFEFPDPATPPHPIPAEDFIGNAEEVGRLRLYAGHPLVEAISDLKVGVKFRSTFFIWNNTTFSYQPFAGEFVTLLLTPELPLVPSDLLPQLPIAGPLLTDAAGAISVDVELPSQASIRFRYETAGKTYGNRLFDDVIYTATHKARSYVDSALVNAHPYKAKYEIYPGYQAFLDDIAARGKFETVEKDRGNASSTDQSTPTDLTSIALAIVEVILPDKLEPRIAFSQHDLHKQIASFEAFHKLDALPPKQDTFNLLVEGDSWTNYPLAFNDLYSRLDAKFQSKLKAGMAYNRIPLQHFGDRGEQMFVTAPGEKRQWDFTVDFLREYQIDLILCSAGGNDFAEPGISNSFDVEPYDQLFNSEGFFDPFAAQSQLTPAQLAEATSLMTRSFAVMLRNHPWSLYVRGLPQTAQQSEAALSAVLDPLLASIGSGDFGYTSAEVDALFAQAHQIASSTFPNPTSIVNPTLADIVANAESFSEDYLHDLVLRYVLQVIGPKVIANFPDEPPPGSSAELLINTVFDTNSSKTGYFDLRYQEVENNWRVLLVAAKALGIPVITHTYGYPLFNESPASLLGLGREALAGPWFTHRFAEARIADRRVRKICLKAFLDRFVKTVFTQFKSQYQFDYVDSRNLNSHVDFWRDELHLHATGFKKLADEVFDKAQQWPSVARFFEI